MKDRRMTLKQIETFRIVMQTGSMTETASRLHTSQPQISRVIGQLEAVVGFALFERRGTRLSASLDGKRFLQDVEKAFVGLEVLEAAASNIRSFAGERLSVAAMPRIAGGLLTRAVVNLKKELPESLVTIHSGAASTVNTWVASGLCDLGAAILYGDDTPGLRVETLMQMDCVVVFPKGHRFAHLEQVEAADLNGEDFVSFPVGSAPRERIDQALATAGAKPRTVLESDLGASVCAFVSAGLGVSVINPFAAFEEQRTGNFEVRALKPAMPIRLVLLRPSDAPESRLVMRFIKHLKRVVQAEQKRHERL
ncbi:MAG: transcriptional regulator, LysR family [Polaromonas sp.]|nr:transcriptional regulator, LysR family [Polaromonas sp.]